MTIAAPLPLLFPRTTSTTAVTVYSTWRSLAGWRLRLVLDRAGVAYRFVDTDWSPEVKETLHTLADHGTSERPIVHLDGEWMSDPDPENLRVALVRHGLVTPRGRINR